MLSIYILETKKTEHIENNKLNDKYCFTNNVHFFSTLFFLFWELIIMEKIDSKKKRNKSIIITEKTESGIYKRMNVLQKTEATN